MLPKFLFTVLALLLVSFCEAQAVLTLSDAIAFALENNLEIKLAKNDMELAKNENYAGNAGMRPSVVLNVNETPAVANLRQELANGQTIVRNNVLSHSFGSNMVLGYTLYDGMRMYATRNRLKELEQMGQLQVKSSIQNTVSQVIAAYANILRQQGVLKVLQSLEKVSKERLTLVDARKLSGLANNADLYLVQLEVDQRRQAADAQKVLIANAKTRLSLLMNKPENFEFEVSNDLGQVQEFDKSTLQNAMNKNPAWMMADKQMLIAELVKREVNSAFYPLVRMSAQVGYSVSQTQAGFLLLNQNLGTNAGFGLSLPLYTGQVNKRNLEGANIQLKRTGLQQEQVRQNLNNSFELAWQNYEAFKKFVVEDKAAVDIASNLLSLVELRYKAGEGTVLDFREVQRTYEEINNRYINNQFTLKLAETDLLNLTGSLVLE